MRANIRIREANSIAKGEDGMSDLVLAIDQGTTGTTVFVIDSSGRVRGRAYREIHQYYPRPGWVEHDAEEIAHAAIGLGKAACSLSGVKAPRSLSNPVVRSNCPENSATRSIARNTSSVSTSSN